MESLLRNGARGRFKEPPTSVLRFRSLSSPNVDRRSLREFACAPRQTETQYVVPSASASKETYFDLARHLFPNRKNVIALL
jgi:hypothetical protein